MKTEKLDASPNTIGLTTKKEQVASSLSEFEKYRRMQMEQFEDDIADGRCYPEMPEGQFVRGK
ncbi:MAG: hypothetical protein J6X31_05225 [Bacteroidales bacterium]|nr:hypothetical protein [Bacteroidales bacterium]